MNLPNTLTVVRIILVPMLMIFLLVRIPLGDYLAALVFSVAALTDSIDGYIARRNRQVTKLGIFLDPLADKLLLTAALVSLVELQRIPAWPVVIILAREFAVTGLRAIKAEEGLVIPASKWGKAKTVVQIVAVLIVILYPLFERYIAWPVNVWAIYLAVAITVYSGIDYFVRLTGKSGPRN